MLGFVDLVKDSRSAHCCVLIKFEDVGMSSFVVWR